VGPTTGLDTVVKKKILLLPEMEQTFTNSMRKVIFQTVQTLC